MNIMQTPAVTECIGDVLRQAAAQLEASSDSAALDAELLLASLLNCSRGQLLTRGEHTLDAGSQLRFEALLQRRREGVPVAYLLERREFWSLDLRVTPDVLIPRPETELLVERALCVLRERMAPRVLELGTGSGAIALALARERPDAQLTATDRSPAALQVARDNAERLGLQQVCFIESDWFSVLPPQRCDLILSNPPYVAVGDPALQAAVATHEPAIALYAEQAGLADLFAIIDAAPSHLVADGTLLLEHGATQGEAVRVRLQQAGYVGIETWPDLAGHPRVSGGHLA